jgi:MFS family permease
MVAIALYNATVSALRQFLEQSRAVQVLLVNELTIFLSFYMLYPYLAIYFRDTLGFSTWMVGLVLGLRVLSQQGLNVIGGTLADRLGYKPLIIAGLALRAVGFALFGLVASLSGILIAAILTGLAGALFGPALRAYLAAESPSGRRAEVFALANLAGQIGTLLGPPVGVALLGLSFRLVCLASGAIFLGLMLLQFWYLPRRVDLATEGAQPVLRDWAEVVANRGFLLFAAVMLAYSVLLSQMYLTLPLEARRATGSDAAVGALFVLSSVLAIVGQVRVTAWCQAHYRPPEAVALGLALMTVGFAAPLAAALVGHAGAAAGGGSMVTALGPTLAAMTFLTVGAMVASPFAMAMVPRFGRDRLIATYFGFYAMAGGIGSTVGNALVGAALDAQSRPGLVGLPWGLMLALGAGATVALRHLDRRGLLA